MVDPQAILDFSDGVARRFKPEKIILFGSYAYGTPTDDSDVDLLVILRFRGSPIDKSVEISSAVDAHFAMDLVVRSAATVRRRLQLNDYFLMDIFEKGVILHDAADKRVGRKGRSRLLRRFPVTAVA